MNLLQDGSKAIQSEAFQIFCIFVESLEACSRVRQILFKNKDRLVKLLRSMHKDFAEAGDERLKDDLESMAYMLQGLDPCATPTRSRTSSSDSSTHQQMREKQVM